MSTKRLPIEPDTRLQWFGAVDAGKQLELFAEIDGKGHSLITVVASDLDESLWLEFEAGHHLVRVPLSRVREMLEVAPGNVHSEAWYEKNLYSKQEDI